MQYFGQRSKKTEGDPRVMICFPRIIGAIPVFLFSSYFSP